MDHDVDDGIGEGGRVASSVVAVTEPLVIRVPAFLRKPEFGSGERQELVTML